MLVFYLFFISLLVLRNLRNRIIQDRKTLSHLTIPRSRIVLESVDSKHCDDKNSLFVVLRVITFSDESLLNQCLSECNNYTALAGFFNGCVSSALNHVLDDKKKLQISQVWKDVDSFRAHLNTDDFKNYQKLLSDKQLLEGVSVNQVF